MDKGFVARYNNDHGNAVHNHDDKAPFSPCYRELLQNNNIGYDNQTYNSGWDNQMSREPCWNNENITGTDSDKG